MGLSRVQSRGQVTISAEVRKAAGIQPGDVVFFEAVGVGKVSLTVLPGREPLKEVFRRYGGPGVVPENLWERVEADMAGDISQSAPPEPGVRGGE